jgi:uncharacterized protein
VILADVNIFVYAFRTDAVDHEKYRDWLEEQVNSPQAFGVASVALSGFIRIVTHPQVFSDPASLDEAICFAETLRGLPNCVDVRPGPRHWEIFSDLCRKANARGNLIPDAYLAALAIESGSEWITADRDYARFPGLRWRHPFDDKRRFH